MNFLFKPYYQLTAIDGLAIGIFYLSLYAIGYFVYWLITKNK